MKKPQVCLGLLIGIQVYWRFRTGEFLTRFLHFPNTLGLPLSDFYSVTIIQKPYYFVYMGASNNQKPSYKPEVVRLFYPTERTRNL